MQILNRPVRLAERGKIKIGGLGETRKSKEGKEYRLPIRFDHFVVTTMERDAKGDFVHDVELMKIIGDATDQSPDKLTRLPIRLIWNDPALNIATRYVAYAGKSVWCSGNGDEAQRLGALAKGKPNEYGSVKCPCERIEPGYSELVKNKESPAPICKIAGLLSLLIEGAPGVGGVWKFRTGSFNSVDGLVGSLAFMQGITGGQLANIPLDLVLNSKQVTRPDGKAQKIFFVSIEFRGSIDDLREKGYKVALENSQANLRIEHIEAEARKSMETVPPNQVFDGENTAEDAQEFAPEGEVVEEPEAPPLKPPGGEQLSESAGIDPENKKPSRRKSKPAEAPQPPNKKPAEPEEDHPAIAPPRIIVEAEATGEAPEEDIF